MRRPSLLYEIAHVLDVSTLQIDRALRQSPRVVERVDRIQQTLRALRMSHVTNNEPWRAPKAGDPLVRDLAEQLGRSAASVGRVVSLVLSADRSRMMWMDRETISAMYEQQPARRERAVGTIERAGSLHMQELSDLPRRLDQFFRYAVSAGTLGAMMRLSGQWSPALRVGISVDAIRTLPREFVEVQVGLRSSRIKLRLTGYGVRHLRTFRPWYLALHPSVAKEFATPGPVRGVFRPAVTGDSQDS
jgi:hypothetical protein